MPFGIPSLVGEGPVHHRITVCTSCRPKGRAEKPGLALIDKLRGRLSAGEQSGAAGFRVAGLACMAGCEHPCAVAFHASDKATYLFGDIADEADLDSLVDFARLYAALHDGWCSSVDRPAGLRKKTLARVPASLFPAQAGQEEER